MFQQKDSTKIQIMGIVNITEDSFSDGGKYIKTDEAIKHALQLNKEGAKIIDLGAASSNINSNPVSDEIEIKRLKPVIEDLKSKNILISVDTFKPKVQLECIKMGVNYINDIQGFPYKEIYGYLAQAKNCKLIVMHSMQRIGKATIMNTNPESVYISMIEFMNKRLNELRNAGVQEQNLIIDPGMGFFLGSDPNVSIYMLQKLNKIKETLNLPLLIGISRKSFLSKISGCAKDDCAASTLSAELFAAQLGVDIIRTHQPKQLNEAIKIWESLKE